MSKEAMFIHQEQLEHLLSPREYHDPQCLQRERERLFQPGWHFLAAKAELPRPGDFLTRDVLGEPLLVRNHDGQLHAYLNVCAHRHSRLRSEAHGHDPHFRCQYHGWEYQCDGRTAKIPDARCFRPFDRDNAQLHKFRTASWGDMTFVSLADNGLSLAEFLGPLKEQESRWFGLPHRLAWVWETEYQANWKIVVENSLESYHIPCLHQKSFGISPPEETCQHDLNDRYTTFHTREMYSWISQVQNFLVRSVGGSVTNVYTHHHAHPHLIFIAMDVMRMAQLVLPIAPNRTCHRVWVWALEGTRRNPWAVMIRRLLRWLVVRTARQIILEDAPIFPQVQRGLEASRFRGVIGTREERVYAFQHHLRQMREP